MSKEKNISSNASVGQLAKVIIFVLSCLGLTIVLVQLTGINQQNWIIGWCQVHEKKINSVYEGRYRVNYTETVGFGDSICKNNQPQTKSFASAEEAVLWAKVYSGNVCWIRKPADCNKLVHIDHDANPTTINDYIGGYVAMFCLALIANFFIWLLLAIPIYMIQMKTFNVSRVICSLMSEH